MKQLLLSWLERKLRTVPFNKTPISNRISLSLFLSDRRNVATINLIRARAIIRYSFPSDRYSCPSAMNRALKIKNNLLERLVDCYSCKSEP